jgi:hypothetical protein
MNACLHQLYRGVLAILLLAGAGGLRAQEVNSSEQASSGSVIDRRKDSSFSVFVDAGIGFSHANDAHINRWLAKYNYPTEPRVPSSLHIAVDAMPVRSRLMYSIRISTILNGRNLSSYNLMGGLYTALVANPQFLLLIGAGAGFHKDIITLNGDLPADYQALARQYNTQLSLHRTGLFLEPAVRAFWYPISGKVWQLGIFGSAGFDMDINSQWKLGYYNNNHGEYGRFTKLKKPADQKKVSEHGIAFCSGISARLHFY